MVSYVRVLPECQSLLSGMLAHITQVLAQFMATTRLQYHKVELVYSDTLYIISDVGGGVTFLYHLYFSKGSETLPLH